MDLNTCHECGNIYEGGFQGLADCPVCKVRKVLSEKIAKLEKRLSDMRMVI